MSCFIRTGFLVSCTGLLVFSYAGCRREGAKFEHENTASERKAQQLDAESARTALIEMIEREQETRSDFLKLLLPSLKKDPIDANDPDFRPGEVRIGGWRCDLRNATFDVSIVFPKADMHAWNDWHGVFEPAEGKWRAKVNGFQSFHRFPNVQKEKQ